MNITPLLHEYLEHSEYLNGYSKVTIKNYKMVISSFLNRSQVSDTTELTKKCLHSYFLNGRVKRKWSTGSFTTYYMTLRSFFNWCCEYGHLTENPVISIPYPKVKRKVPKPLTRSEAEKILTLSRDYPYLGKFLHSRNHAIIATFIFTGLRKMELLNLTLADVNLENQSIYVSHGKGDKPRYVPIPLRLKSILETYVKERKGLKKSCQQFFISSNGNYGLTAKGWKYLVGILSQTSGIYFRAHTLRHTFATLMLEGGCNIYALSKMMGHSSIQTTIIYLHASAQHVAAEALKHPLNV